MCEMGEVDAGVGEEGWMTTRNVMQGEWLEGCEGGAEGALECKNARRRALILWGGCGSRRMSSRRLPIAVHRRPLILGMGILWDTRFVHSLLCCV